MKQWFGYFPPPPVTHRLHRDPQLYLVLLGTLLTGIGLWWLLPAGFAGAAFAHPWLLFNMLLLSPVVEEWLCRGVLQGELLRQAWGRVRHLGISRANGLTSIAFVLLHLVYHPWLWALAVIVPSLVLGYLRERYANLWLPIVLHSLFNLTYLLAGLPWAQSDVLR